LNAELDWREIEDEFLSKDISPVCIDGFLSDDGLQYMREFCLSSTIWKKIIRLAKQTANELIERHGNDARKHPPKTVPGPRPFSPVALPH